MARDTSKDMQFALEDSGFGSLLDAGFQGFGGDPSTSNTPSFIQNLLPEKPEFNLMTPTDFLEQSTQETDAFHESMIADMEEGSSFMGALGERKTMDKGLSIGTTMKKDSANYDTFNKFNKDFNRAYYHKNVDKDKYPSYKDFIDKGLGSMGMASETGGLEITYELGPNQSIVPTISWGSKDNQKMNADMIYDYNKMDDTAFANKYFSKKVNQGWSPEAIKRSFGKSEAYKYMDKYLEQVNMEGSEYKQLSPLDHLGMDYREIEY